MLVAENLREPRELRANFSPQSDINQVTSGETSLVNFCVFARNESELNDRLSFLSLSSSSKMRERKDAKDSKTNELGRIKIIRTIKVAKIETNVCIAFDAFAITVGHIPMSTI